MNTTLMNAQYHATALKVIEVYNGTEPIETLSQLVAPNVQAQHVMIPPVKDLSGYMQLAKSWRTVFSPFGVSLKALWDGPAQNEVTAMWHVRGKFVKDFGPIKPNQKWVEMTGFTTWKFDNEGRIVSDNSLWDGDGMVRQLRGETEVAQFT